LDLSVVVPVRDDADGLCRLLSLLPRGLREVVVLDDGSTPTQAERIAACATRCSAILVRHESSLGPGAARNAGAAIAGGSMLAFLDSDVEPEGDWSEELLAHFARAGVAIVAPRVRSSPGGGLLAEYESARSPLDLGDEAARVAPGTRVSYVPSAALVVSREEFEHLGGFDTDLRHGEDVDLVWRAVEAGCEVRYEPAVEMGHRPRPTWWAWTRQRFDYGTSAAALDRRHPGQVAPAVLSPWSLALWALLLSGHPIAAGCLGAYTVEALRRRLTDVPSGEVARLVLHGHLGAGRQLARAGVRVWWPPLVLASLFSSRVRRIAASALVVHLATTPGPWWRRGLAVADDVAYGAGVWRGVARLRSARALLPRLPH
jgi:mycofactocin system glycosyltransferase